MAEIEFSVLTRACLQERNADPDALARAINAYEVQRTPPRPPSTGGSTLKLDFVHLGGVGEDVGELSVNCGWGFSAAGFQPRQCNISVGQPQHEVRRFRHVSNFCAKSSQDARTKLHRLYPCHFKIDYQVTEVFTRRWRPLPGADPVPGPDHRIQVPVRNPAAPPSVSPRARLSGDTGSHSIPRRHQRTAGHTAASHR